MDIRGSFIMRPNRGELMRPGFPPFRGRGPILMDPRVRLPPRPHPMMLGGPPPFRGGRPIMPPGRPRGPVLLPHRVPLPGPPGPMGHRGMFSPPRHMLPLPLPRPLRPDMNELNENNKISANDAIVPVNKTNESNETQNIKDVQDNQIKNNHVIRNSQTNQNQLMNKNRNRKDIRNRRPLHSGPVPNQPMQNLHPGMHHPSQGSQNLPSQQHIDMNSSIQKHVPLIQSIGSGIQSVQPPLQNNSVRENRNDLPQRNRGNAPMGNRGNIPINYSPNMPNAVSNRPNALINGPPPGHVPSNIYQGGPPPPSFSAAPAQMPLKRGAPPSVNMPAATGMPMKRMRYDVPGSANGYPLPTFQQPPPAQPSYHMPYEVPTAQPPVPQTQDMYSTAYAPNNTSIPSVQTYNNDYFDYQMTPQSSQTYGSNMNSYNNTYSNQSYSTPYSSTTGYEATMDYSTTQSQNVPTADVYASNVDPYGYNNATYTTTQTGYEDYSGAGFVDESGYGQTAPVVDQSYSQPMNAYSSYSY